MSDPSPFLSMLAESAAAIVAIVGGFLVSRLVAISSEREGLRRQLGDARDNLRQVTTSFTEAHDYRLANSEAKFTDWVLDDLVGVDPSDVNRDELLDKNIPRGSSRAEMAAHLDRLVTRVVHAQAQVVQHLREGDTQAVELDDLEGRGLAVPDEERTIYRQVVRWIAEEHLPQPSNPYGLGVPLMRMRDIVSQAAVSTDLRRLDDSIHEEQTLAATERVLEAQVERIKTELSLLGSPVGVTSAILVLTFYSVVGVVLPVVVMGAAIGDWMLIENPGGARRFDVRSYRSFFAAESDPQADDQEWLDRLGEVTDSLDVQDDPLHDARIEQLRQIYLAAATLMVRFHDAEPELAALSETTLKSATALCERSPSQRAS